MPKPFFYPAQDSPAPRAGLEVGLDHVPVSAGFRPAAFIVATGLQDRYAAGRFTSFAVLGPVAAIAAVGQLGDCLGRLAVHLYSDLNQGVGAHRDSAATHQIFRPIDGGWGSPTHAGRAIFV
ncbi:MAG: hypothetical protein OXF50_24590 [Caldilineaceae bacterium]|nr:hypothetical protein [Caldilineaceae bacterium]